MKELLERIENLVLILAASIMLLTVSGCATIGAGHYDEQKLRAKYINSESEVVEYNGLKIHYRKEGTGEPVVLLHGVLSSLHTWDDWTEQLKEKYTVYRFDLPGFGFSELTGGTTVADVYDEDTFVDTLEGVFLKLGLSKFHLAGNSLGGYIAWNYALDRPHQVKSLTVIDPASYYQEMPFLLSMSANPFVRPVSRRIVPKAIFNHGLNQVYANPDRIPDSVKQRYYDLLMRKGNKDAFIEVAGVMKRLARKEELGAEIKDIKSPTLVMWGAHDTWVPVHFASHWQEDIPESRVIIYHDAGHVPMEEIPDKTVRDFMNFIGGIQN